MAIALCEPHAGGMPSRQEIEETAARLKAARLAINPNQTEFANEAGLSQHRYNQYETGSRALTLDAAIKLHKRYGLSLDWLFRGETAMMPHGLVERLRREA